MEDKIYYSGLTAGGLLQAMLICLKAANLTTWSWWWIFAPLWVSLALVIISLLLVAYMLYAHKPKEESTPAETKPEEPKEEPKVESTVSSTSEVPAEKMSKPVTSRPKPKKKMEEVIPVVEDPNKVIVVTVAEELKKEEPVKKATKKPKVETKVEPKVEPKEDAPKEVKETKPKAKKTRKKKADGEDTKSTAKGDTNK